jgi:hypothetical protein
MDTNSGRASFSSTRPGDSGVSDGPQEVPEGSSTSSGPRPAQTPQGGPLSTGRTTRSASSSHHSLSSSATPPAGQPLPNRKSRQADPGTTEAHAERASLSMPPPFTRPPVQQQASNLQQVKGRPSFSSSRKVSGALEDPTVVRRLSQAFASDNNSTGTVVLDPEGPTETTPRLMPGSFPGEIPTHGQLSESAVTSGPASRASFSTADSVDAVGKRMSVSSMYSLASARGVPSSAVSANGSETSSTAPLPGSVHRTKSGLIAASVGGGTKIASRATAPPTAQSEAGLSSVTVTTGSSSVATGSYDMAPKEANPGHLTEMIKRNPPPLPAAGPGASGAQGRPPAPTRSRSRAKRRFSGGNVAPNSQSPSSDRAQAPRHEKEEVKPAPYGTIGVCALDVKARSKPSRNILTRLLAHGMFDVCVFGDKVILDEPIENWPVW